MNDLISRQAAIDAMRKLRKWYVAREEHKNVGFLYDDVMFTLDKLPSAEPELLTDKEQRIFLAAIAREEKVCKQVDEECRDCREPYEDSLVRTCREITRKVKGVLWT